MRPDVTELDYKDFSRHIPKIVGFGDCFENLTSKQIYWIAFLMEEQYQKGKQDAAHDVGKYGPKTSGKLRDLTVHVNFEGEDIQEIVRKAIKKEFETLSKLYSSGSVY
jgi:hypothetical protein